MVYITKDELSCLEVGGTIPKATRTKYGAIKVIINGIVFDSKDVWGNNNGNLMEGAKK